jgi:hypothetical protein
MGAGADLLAADRLHQAAECILAARSAPPKDCALVTRTLSDPRQAQGARARIEAARSLLGKAEGRRQILPAKIPSTPGFGHANAREKPLESRNG